MIRRTNLTRGRFRSSLQGFFVEVGLDKFSGRQIRRSWRKNGQYSCVGKDYSSTPWELSTPEKLNQEVQRSNGVSPFSFDGVNIGRKLIPQWVTIDMKQLEIACGPADGPFSSHADHGHAIIFQSGKQSHDCFYLFLNSNYFEHWRHGASSQRTTIAGGIANVTAQITGVVNNPGARHISAYYPHHSDATTCFDGIDA